jgi:adhesin transport system membrane fusion protein
VKASDFAFANDVRAAIELETPRTLQVFVKVIGAFLLIAVIWAYFAMVEEVTRAVAKVVPSRQMQVVQSLEGGLVQEIGIREGDIVKAGQVLMRIDDTAFSSQFGEVRERRAALQARVARLELEARLEGPGTLTLPADLESEFPRAVAAERALLDARLRKHGQDLSILDQQIDQKLREREELGAQTRRLAANKPLLDRELAITKRLHGERVVPEIEMIRLERQVADLAGQIAVNQASLERADAAVREAQARRTGAVVAFRSAAEEDLTKARGDLAVIEETIRAAEDRVRRTELRAPVRGIVNKLHVTTIGAVVQPGMVLIDIVPLDDTLLVEGRVRPQDIGFVRPGQSAVVKITAYDSAVFGSLQGRVERISADTTSDQRGESFYRVMIRTDRNFIGQEAEPLPIIPGMVAQIEILTGQKSVLSYLLKPARLLRDEAFKER